MPTAASESSVARWTAVDPDVRLMLAVRDGSASAFEELVRRYQGRLLRVLVHLTGSRDTADDLAQEVFLRVYRSRGRYVPGARFSTWLFTIANHVALNAQRARSRRKEVQVDARASGPLGPQPLEQLAQEASGLLPTRQVARQELRDQVRTSLAVLNERQRMAVLLNKFEGLGYAEIAESMGLSVPAIKSLLSRARAQLREALAPYLTDEEGAATTPTAPSAGPDAAPTGVDHE